MASTSSARSPARNPKIISTVLPDGLLDDRWSLISALFIVKGLGPFVTTSSMGELTYIRKLAVAVTVAKVPRNP